MGRCEYQNKKGKEHQEERCYNSFLDDDYVRFGCLKFRHVEMTIVYPSADHFDDADKRMRLMFDPSGIPFPITSHKFLFAYFPVYSFDNFKMTLNMRSNSQKCVVLSPHELK